MNDNPILLKAGDKRVLINGTPPKVDCRIVAEENYQDLLASRGSRILSEVANLHAEEMEELRGTVSATLVTLEVIEQQIARLKSHLTTSMVIMFIGIVTQFWITAIVILGHLEK